MNVFVYKTIIIIIIIIIIFIQRAISHKVIFRTALWKYYKTVKAIQNNATQMWKI